MVICLLLLGALCNLFHKERRETGMKKYLAPEVETLTFAAEEAIALGSNQYNDAEFGGW